ncbi:MAG: gliding motility-associated C-terminal domain-containing protein [Flavobacteriales bacterium]|nr:gliding motility-associated C-terminal domain-containing protein [Flavobacteriales bacterium]
MRTTYRPLVGLLALLFCSIQAFAQPNTFQISYDVGLLDLMGSVKQLPSDNYIVSGTTVSGLFPSASLMEVDDAGSVVWAKSYSYGFFTASLFNDARRTSDGGFIAAGSGPNSGDQGMLTKTTSTGTVTWAKGYGGSDSESFNVARQTSDGGYIACGTTHSFGGKDSTNVYVLKTNSSGTMTWDRAIVLNTTHDLNHSANDIVENPGDGYYCTGRISEINGSDTTSDILLFKLNTSGVVQWIKSYGAIGDYEEGYSIELLPTNELLISGTTDASASGLDAGDAFMMKTDLSGNIVWSRAYDLGFQDISNNGYLMSDGNLVSIGWTIQNVFPLSISAYVLKTNVSTGAVMFAERFTVGIGNILGEGQETSDGGFVIAGMTGNTSWDWHLIKTDGTALSGCNESSYGAILRTFSPAAATPSPGYYSGGSTSNYSVSVSNLSPTLLVDCIDVPCTPPTAPTASASPTSICQGQSSTISGSGSGSNITYNVYTASTGGTLLGEAPLSQSPSVTTTYYVEAIDELLCASARTPITVTVIPIDNPAWTSPGSVCEAGGTINLNTYITGTTGGTFSGTGVSGNVFNPATAGAGSHTITYSVGASPCTQTQQQSITVIGEPNPAWTNPGSICEAAGSINLSTYVTGDAGGTWSGTGVSGNSFDPVAAGPGSHTVTYTVGTNPCQESQNQTITVIADVDPSWAGTTVCESGSVLDLTTLVTGTAGGTWSGPGVSGTNFNPATAGGGSHTITYTVGTNPCQESQQQTINVVDQANPAWSAPATACVAAGSIDLSLLITGNSGGTFTGTGVSGNSFNPTTAGVGTHTITYTVGVNPCQETESHDITVIGDVDPSWTTTTSCADVPLIDLTTLITGTSGGTWSGPGISGNSFSPGSVGAGTHSITYTVGTSPCEETLTQDIVVEPVSDASWNAPSIVCEAAGVIDLNSLITGTTGGTWSGIGVSGSSFDPTAAGNGTHAITYTVGNQPCEATSTQNIQVELDVDPSWTSPGSICEADGVIDLNSLLTGDAGGTWSGSGVSGNLFNPAGLSGAVAITYSIGNSPCTEISTQNITVTPQVSADWTSPGVVCEGGGTINLNSLVTGTSGGTWTGTGVSGSTFDPTGLDGSYSVTYAVGTSPCNDSQTYDISVLPAVDAAWTAPAVICEVEGIIDLNLLVTGTPNGAWSGTGVSAGAGTFDPTGLNGQTVSITYTVGQNQCEEINTQSIQIENVSAAWAGPDTICESDGILALSGLVTGDAGGTWSGTGVTGSQFNPVGISGSVTLTYSVGSAPCLDEVSRDIYVNASPLEPNVSASDQIICFGDETELTASGSGNNVTYEVYDAATGGSLVGQTPVTVSPSSTQTYYIIAENQNGCTNLSGRQPITVTVNELPIADAGDDLVVCLNEPVELTASGGTEYLWSTSETSSTITVSPQTDGWYTVLVTDENDCSASDSVFVEVNIPIQPIAVLDTGTTENVDPLTIFVLNNDTANSVVVSIVTEPVSGTASVDGQDVIYEPTAGYVGMDSLQYTICDDFCQNVCDTAWIVIKVIDEIPLFIPSGFSPNGDDINDMFEILGLHKFPNHQLVILNRWGDVVYESAPYLNDWHGQTPNAKLRFTGDEVVDGTYFYVFYPYGNEKDIRRGTIELRRN